MVQQETDVILLCRWDAGGFRETVWKGGWDAGSEVLAFFSLASRPHWLGYRPGDGRVQLCRWDPTDGKSEAVWSDEWGRNYVLMPFELDGRPHLALYRPEDGQAQLYRWNPDGSRVPISWEEWGQGYALMPLVLPRERWGERRGGEGEQREGEEKKVRWERDPRHPWALSEIGTIGDFM